MLTCREVTRLATDAAEGALPWWRRPQWWLHLAMCAACRRYLRQLALIRAVLRQVGDREPPTGTSVAVQDAFRQMARDKFE